MTLEDQIRKLANEWYNKKAAAGKLGMSVKKLNQMLELMPDVTWPRSNTPLTEEQANRIERLAKMGHSRTQAAEILGVSMMRMRIFCSRMPWVEWPVRSLYRKETDQQKKGRAELFPHLEESRVKAKAAIAAKSQKTVLGVTGTVKELVDHFQPGISASTVRRHLAAGIPLEEALFMPKAVRKPKVREWYVGSVLRTGHYNGVGLRA